MHPELRLEAGAKELLRAHRELARLLMEDPEADRCDMGARLFEELESLRDLHERRELEEAKRALEENLRQKDLLKRDRSSHQKQLTDCFRPTESPSKECW